MFEENQGGIIPTMQLRSIPFIVTTTQGTYPQKLHIPKNLGHAHAGNSPSLLSQPNIPLQSIKRPILTLLLWSEHHQAKTS